ncbi:MAG: DUF5522 domain-containing protein [Acidimicrobiales bacterium]
MAPPPNPSDATVPPERVAVLAAHDAAVAGGADGYIDPETGLFVFTSVYLASVGACCGSGCRHCPYPKL